MFGQCLLSGAFGGASDGTDYFNTVLYTGNDVSHAITGVGFQPDLVWIKRRNSSEDHALYDSIRGINKQLSSNTNAAEVTNTAPNEGFTSFDTDGFTVNNNGATNRAPNTYVAWNWKAGGAASANTAGTLSSQVSANQNAGFSIVKYDYPTANSSTVRTVGHGLAVAPELMIIKPYEGIATNPGATWFVYNAVSGNTKEMQLQTNNGDGTDANRWNSTSPTAGASTGVITLGTSFSSYAADYYGGDTIAYCWHSVAGYSKIGSYTATQTAGSPTVTTGFKPRWLLVKNLDRQQEWVIVDSARGNNPGESLLPNSPGAESSSNSVIFTSTGFTINTTGQGNNYKTGDTMLYMAFA